MYLLLWLLIEASQGFKIVQIIRHASSMRQIFDVYAVIPRDVVLNVSNIDITRVLGKIELEVALFQGGQRQRKPSSRESIPGAEDWGLDGVFASQSRSDTRETSLRLYEGLVFLSGNRSNAIRCYFKEVLESGSDFGANELSVTRKLTNVWNKYQNESMWEGKKKTLIYKHQFPPFPTLVGTFISDESIESTEFRRLWRSRFPRNPFPSPGNRWLAFRWDESSFKSMRRFPSLPQLVEGLDYFRPAQRADKRWLFVRCCLRHALESLDFLHTHGYSHNSVNIQSIWLSTTDEQERRRRPGSLRAVLADLGSCQKLQLGDARFARVAVLEDFYQLAFVFLEFVIASFVDDNAKGARAVRAMIGLCC
jgi:hypothetical protein